MSLFISLNYDYIAEHINEYIDNGSFFDIFDEEDIKGIMEHSNFTPNQYADLLRQFASTLNIERLFIYTRNAKVSVKSIEDAISILNSAKEYMKFDVFDGVIDILKKNETEIN